MVGVFSRCEEPVELGVVIQNDALIVNSVLYPEALAEVRVGTIRSYATNDEADFVDDAVVEIYGIGDDPEAVLIYQPGTNGIYRAEEFAPRSGMTYEVKVYADEYGISSGQSYVPFPSQITGLESGNLVITEAGGDHIYSFDLQIEYEDASDELNFYHLRLFQGRDQFIVSTDGDTIILDSTKELIEFPPAPGYEYQMAGNNDGILFADGAISGRHVFSLASRIDPEKELFGEIYTELRTVTQEYYKYQNSVANSSVNIGGFTQPGSSYGNVKNGAGSVTGYSGSLDTIVIN